MSQQFLQWEEVEKVVDHARSPILLYGRPGTGKTHLCALLAKYSLTLTQDTPSAELRGHWIPKGQDWSWHDGPITRAWREGVPLALHEIDQAGADTLTYLYSVLDDPAVASLTLPSGETIRPKAGFRVLATCNGEPDDLPAALADRFAISISIDSVNPAAMAALPDNLKHLPQNGDHALPLRQLMAFADLSMGIGGEIAARAIFGHRAVEVLNAIALRPIA